MNRTFNDPKEHPFVNPDIANKIVLMCYQWLDGAEFTLSYVQCHIPCLSKRVCLEPKVDRWTGDWADDIIETTLFHSCANIALRARVL